MSDVNPVSRIALSEALNALREELLSAEAKKTKGPSFEISELEVSFEVMASREVSGEAEAGGKIRFWFVDANTKAKVGGTSSSAITHRVTLKLNVQGADGSSLAISDQVKSPRASKTAQSNGD